MRRGYKHTSDSVRNQTQRSILVGWGLSEDEDGSEDGLPSDMEPEDLTEDNLDTSASANRKAELSVPGA